jgi:hypothetical protein
MVYSRFLDEKRQEMQGKKFDVWYFKDDQGIRISTGYDHDTDDTEEFLLSLWSVIMALCIW